MAASSPQSPVRADHRFLREIITSLLGGKVTPMPAEFDMLSRVFHKAGGSWERIFGGSPEDIWLLKAVVKRAFKKGLLTKSPDWGD
jgi:hypothetical protein